MSITVTKELKWTTATAKSKSWQVEMTLDGNSVTATWPYSDEPEMESLSHEAILDLIVKQNRNDFMFRWKAEQQAEAVQKLYNYLHPM